MASLTKSSEVFNGEVFPAYVDFVATSRRPCVHSKEAKVVLSFARTREWASTFSA